MVGVFGITIVTGLDVMNRRVNDKRNSSNTGREPAGRCNKGSTAETEMQTFKLRRRYDRDMKAARLKLGATLFTVKRKGIDLARSNHNFMNST